MRFPNVLSMFGHWLYASQATRLFSAGARGNFHLSQADKARDFGEWAKAAVHYEICLNNLTHRYDIWIQLGNVRKEMGDLSGSRAAYEAALALTTGNSDLALQLGHLTKIQGYIEEARQWYRRALELDAHNHNAFDELVALGEELQEIAELLSGRGSAVASEHTDQDESVTKRVGLSDVKKIAER